MEQPLHTLARLGYIPLMEDTLKEIARKLDTLVQLTAVIAEELPRSRLERKDLLKVATGRGQVPLSVFLAVTLALSMVIVFGEIRDSNTKLEWGGATLETKRGEYERSKAVVPERFSFRDGDGDTVHPRRVSQ